MEQHLPGGIIPASGLNENSKFYLRQTVRWTNFLAILGFIGTGFMILFALILILGGGAISQYSSQLPIKGMAIGYSLFGVLYLAFSALYFYPVFCLYKFGRLMKYGILSENEVQITEAFRYQRNMYRFMGIMMLVIIGLYTLIIVSVSLTGASRGF